MAPLALSTLGNGGGSDPATAAVDDASAGLPGLASEIDGPIVAHIRDLATGEIGIFHGTEEIIVHDSILASRLAQAVR